MQVLGNGPARADDSEVHEARSGIRSEDAVGADTHLFASVDRLRRTVPWALRDERHEKEMLDAALAKLLDREDYTQADVDALMEAQEARYSGRWYREALTAAEIEDVSARFELPENDLNQLSRRLAASLTPKVEPVLVAVSRTEAMRWAEAKMAEVCTHLMKASEEALKAFDLVQGLTLGGLAEAGVAARLDQTRALHNSVLLDIERIHDRYFALARQTGLLLDLDALDRRTVGDPRRRKILFLLFGFWERTGRPLTITTDPIDNGRRKGPLIDFVNAVVRCITEPARDLSGETIWMDLKAFRATKAKG